MRRLVGLTVVYWILLFALYLACAAQFSGAEIFTGMVAAAVAVTALMAVRAQSQHHFQMSLRWLANFARVPVEVLKDCVIVFKAVLCRPAKAHGSGRFELRPFDPGNEHPSSRMRRALVTTAISLAPNTFVIGVTEENDQLLVHQLAPQPNEQRSSDWPL